MKIERMGWDGEVGRRVRLGMKEDRGKRRNHIEIIVMKVMKEGKKSGISMRGINELIVCTSKI